MKKFQSNVDIAVHKANKDNDVIYMEAVPKPEALISLAPANMVNRTPFPGISDLSVLAGKPLFQSLVPFRIHQAASKYCTKKDALVSQLCAKLQEQAELAHSTLASLRLPGSIQALEQPIGLPPNLAQRNKEVREAGGPTYLRNRYAALIEMAEKNKKLLKEVLPKTNARVCDI